MQANEKQMAASCENILKNCMALKPGETLLVVTDDGRLEIGRALYEAGRALGAAPVLTTMPPASVSGQEPPEPVAAAMRAADVIVCPTTESVTHTRARIEAGKSGARVATMPGITADMFLQGPIKADYNWVEETTHRYTKLLSDARTCQVRTGGDCVLTLDLTGRNGVNSTGVYRLPGQCGNLPSGESYIAPVETGANGRILIDGSVVGVGKLTSPVVLTLENGMLTGAEGEQAQAVLRAIPDNGLSRTIGELGVGTNPEARVTGNILEDEKILGSVHVAFGTNITFGGTVKADSHIDCVTLAPTVLLDGREVIRQGKLLA